MKGCLIFALATLLAVEALAAAHHHQPSALFATADALGRPLVVAPAPIGADARATVSPSFIPMRVRQATTHRLLAATASAAGPFFVSAPGSWTPLLAGLGALVAGFGTVTLSRTPRRARWHTCWTQSTGVVRPSTALRARSRTAPGDTLVVEVDGPWALSKLQSARDILQQGGLGVIPTDTRYAFVCDVHSRSGVERIFQIKNVGTAKKPLSLLCKDISTIAKYAATLTNANYKLLKACLPGPYTFILPAGNEVPKVWLNHKSHMKAWKRKEIGVRMPDDYVCQELLQMLEFPLLCSSVETEKGLDPFTIEESYRKQLDFVVAAGPRGSEDGKISSVVDLTGDTPRLLRRGMGDVSFCPELENEAAL